MSQKGRPLRGDYSSWGLYQPGLLCCLPVWIPDTEGHLSKDLPELQHLGFHLLFAKGTIKDTGQKAFHLQSSSAPLSDTSSPHLTGHCPLRGLLWLLRAALCPVCHLLCHCYGSSSNMHQTAPSLQASTCHSRGLRPSHPPPVCVL